MYLNVNIPEDIDLLWAVLSFMELKALSAKLLVIGIVNSILYAFSMKKNNNPFKVYIKPLCTI